jgi:peptidoglycan/LPS O-acetylase OafA/YrhL
MKNALVPTSRLRKYRPDIQGLRAVAIAMVVTWHVGLVNVHGGVDVSFVLSGFLIGSQLLAEIDKTGTVSFKEFWARRFRRLAPGMAVVIVATVVFAWLFASPLRFRSYAIDGIYSAFSLLNWHLAENGTDYFANNGTQTPYQHFWSLGIEEQFYVAAPLLLVALVWLSRKIFRNRALVAAALVVIIAGSFYLSVTQTQSDQPLAYFGTHTRVWELAIGLLLALSAKLLSRMNLVVAAIMSWVGLAGIIVTAMLITDTTPLPGYAIAGPVLGAAMLIAGGCANPTFGAEWLLRRKPFDFVGKVSYGWYLWHWPLLVLWPDIVGHEITYWDRWRVASLSLLFATAAFYGFEKKIRANQRLVEVPWRGIRRGLITVTATAAAMVAALVVPLNLQTSPATVADGSTTKTVSLDSVKLAANQQDLPSNVQPSLVDAPKDIANFGCIDQLKDPTFNMRSGCVIGDLTAHHTMVVIGDSHAWQWGDAFNEIGKQLKVKVVTMTKSGCSAEDYNIRNDQLGRSYTECTTWRESAMRAIESLHPQVIVVTSRSRREATREGAETTFSQLQNTGAKLIYMTDTPHPGVNIPDCLAKHASNVAACSRQVSDTVEFPEARLMERDVAQAHGAVVLDVLPAFCTATTCPSVIGGRIVYFDDSHVTASYALALVPFLEPAVRVALS